MSTKTKTKTKSKKGKATSSSSAPSIVWFEIPADDLDRAKKFYGALFGWKMDKLPGPKEYWHIATGGGNDSPDGGMMQRQGPEHRITNYVGVPSVNKAAAKVQKLGGKVIMPKTAVPGMGYFVVCMDTENNMFALWERAENAK
jgi:predicted enzyme related to lactoylglutathione lyase